MRYYVAFLVFGFSILTKAQQKITFNYDSAGNQILRELCLSGCSQSAKQAEEVKEIAALTEDDLLKFSSEDVISYYPNPVKEELYIKWELQEGNYITSIQVFSLTGQLLRSYSPNLHNTSQNIPFQEYPRGVYAVMLYYKNGDQKSIKIIKQ
ncbi:T9SS type A sorting domain-containing protein [Flavobacterium aquidurense]|uniref:Por secretion system C-terminal sorting domain containing protein n=1 Tax=Flavobacterium aquidurense TaxID=362413 RepID=A0A0Q0RNE9_9FLAO|nr:T9SS type A sorting domain-containing protein [Flavobacterium aquidurense]KQB37714.1 Por secretion system C-terminal sorting domain containing protein [Flavobacterium aquidurense]